MKKLQCTGQTVSAILLTSLLAACNSTEAPLGINAQLAEELAIAAARVDPCADQYVFQLELNGVPDATYTGNVEDGVIREEQWYASTSTIVYLTYSPDDNWCNVWNESGVAWNR